MKRDDRELGREQTVEREAQRSATQPAPGKVTRTSKLPVEHGPSVQRKERAAGTGATAPQVKSAWEWTMDPWMDAAHRGTPVPDPVGETAVQAKGNVETSDPERVHRAATAGTAGSGGTLPYLEQIQKSFGTTHDLSGVRAHIGGEAAEASDAMGAEAYATGEDIAFRSQPDLHTAAHEAAHVVQQRAGVQLAGGVGEVGDAYEQQADAVAERVVRGESVAHLLAGQGTAGAHTMVQRAPEDETAGVDAGTPELAAYEGVAVGQPGKISAPAGQYAHARSAGVNVRTRPDGTLPEIDKVRYNTAVHVKSLDVTGAFYFIMAGASGIVGWINRDFVALDMPDAHAELHHITEPDLTTILKSHYIDGDLWQLGTGNDYTTLAAAVVAANQGRKGVQIDWDQHRAYKDGHLLKRTLDPWMIDNFAVYHASKVYAGHNIWLPSAAYVRTLQGAGVIGSRPDWVNAAVDVGQGIGGFYAGVYAGVFGSLWDTLAGLWQLGGAIIDTITGILDGSLFQSIQTIYDQVVGLDWADAERMVEEVLTLGKTAFGDFMAQWQHPDTFKKWHFRGRVVGAIALEVVLAIFSGGASLGAKVLAKLGKYFPRLASVLKRLLAVSDELDFGRRHRGKSGKDSDHEPSRDRDEGSDRDDDAQRDWNQTLALARLITEEHDLRDTPVDKLLLHLNTTLAAKSKAVRGYRKHPHPTKPGHHRIVQLSRKSEVDEDYSGDDASTTSGSGVTLAGVADAAHEAAQATRFGQMEGGGRFRFLGDSSRGIEGFFTPSGGQLEIPVSLKDFSSTGNLRNIIGRINRNAAQVNAAGYAGRTVLHASVRQATVEQMMTFIEGGPLSRMASEGVFSRLVFECSDGIVEATASGLVRR